MLVLGYFHLARLLPVAILQFFKCLVGPNFQTTFAVSPPCINGPKNLWNHIFNFRHVWINKINLYFWRFKCLNTYLHMHNVFHEEFGPIVICTLLDNVPRLQSSYKKCMYSLKIRSPPWFASKLGTFQCCFLGKINSNTPFPCSFTVIAIKLRYKRCFFTRVEFILRLSKYKVYIFTTWFDKIKLLDSRFHERDKVISQKGLMHHELNICLTRLGNNDSSFFLHELLKHVLANST